MMKKSALTHRRMYLDPYTKRSFVPEGPLLVQSWEEAQLAMAAQARSLGFADARSTPPGTRDFDIYSRVMLGQVRASAHPTLRPDLLKFHAACEEYRQEPWFFVGFGYSSNAIEYADEKSIYLFRYSITGELEAMNQIAKDRLRELMVNRVKRLEKWTAHSAERQAETPSRQRHQRLRSMTAELARACAELEEFYLSGGGDDEPLAPVVPIFGMREAL